MSILSINTTSPGLVSVRPRIIYIRTNDTLAQVTATGYLNGAIKEGIPLSQSDMALVSTKTTPSAKTEQLFWLEVSVTGSNWSLIQNGGPGSVTLPTIANHIATYTNTTGGLAEDPATAINGGNLQAGLSGTAGALISFPGTALKGNLQLAAVANTGNTITTISNVAMGQASTVSLPDPANAAARFLIAATATPFTAKHFPIASGTGGLMVDSGAQLLAGTTPSYAGGGTSNAFAVTGLSSAASGSCVIRTSTNAVSIAKAVPGTNTLTVTFSADPGAGTTVDYIYSTAALS
jgi:hypothetical protein